MTEKRDPGLELLEITFFFIFGSLKYSNRSSVTKHVVGHLIKILLLEVFQARSEEGNLGANPELAGGTIYMCFLA